MAALMKIRSIFVFTHDSIVWGEERAHTPVHRARRGAALIPT